MKSHSALIIKLSKVKIILLHSFMTLTSGKNSIKPLRQILNCNFEPIVLVVVFAQLRLICHCDQKKKNSFIRCFRKDKKYLLKNIMRGSIHVPSLKISIEPQNFRRTFYVFLLQPERTKQFSPLWFSSYK